MERRRQGMILRSEKVLFRNISSSESELGGSSRSASGLSSRTSSRVSLLEEELADLNREQAEIERQQEERNRRREVLLNELERRSSDSGSMYTVRCAPVQCTSNRVVGWPTRSEHQRSPRCDLPRRRNSWVLGPRRGAATEADIYTPPIEAASSMQINDPTTMPREPQATKPIMPKQVSQLSNHSRYGRTNSGNSDPFDALRYFVNRQSEARELPRFSGDPREFPNFISHYKRTTWVCGFSDEENLNRLQKCLTGQARQAVYALLALPESVGKIIEILERRFGRPELVIGELGQQLRELPGIKENDYEGLICFSSEIQNYVISVEVLGALDYLIEPSMLKTLVSKLPGSVRVQWGEYMLGMSTDVTRVNEFSAWLERKAEAMSLIANHFPDGAEEGATTMATRQGKSTTCRFCNGDPHALAKSPKWLKSSLNARWSWATKGKLCFRCLLPNHSAPKCRSNLECGICQGYHHDTLHKEKESTSQQQSKAQSQAHVEVTHGETHPTSEAQQWKALLRIVPVKLYGPKGMVESHALLDEGSSITMMEQTVADKLGIMGPTKPLSLAWTGQMGRVEDESQAIKLDISGVHEQARKFKLFNVRTVKCLGLRAQTVDVDALAKKWPFILKGAVASSKEAKAEIIIGQDNWPLLASRKTFYGPWKGPVVTQTWLGWVLHGNIPQLERGEEPCSQLSHWEDGMTEEERTDKWVKRELLELEPATKEGNLMSIEERKARELFDSTNKKVGTCSPLVERKVKIENALQYEPEAPRAVSAIIHKHCMESINNEHYVDPVATEEEAIKLLEKVREIHAADGFIICSIASNSKAVMDSLPEELGLPALKDAPGSPEVVSIVGIPRDVTTDQVYVASSWKKLKERWKERGERPTERRRLRMVMLEFDPLGFLQILAKQLSKLCPLPTKEEDW